MTSIIHFQKDHFQMLSIWTIVKLCHFVKTFIMSKGYQLTLTATVPKIWIRDSRFIYRTSVKIPRAQHETSSKIASTALN